MRIDSNSNNPMHSASISLGKDLKGHSIYLRWFLMEHPSERQCLLNMYPTGRRCLVRGLLSTRWITLLETEINMAAALAGIQPADRASHLSSIQAAYQRRPLAKGLSGWVQRLLNANPMRLIR
jgi:hypothetical protein